jgi:hypothetical protein
VENIRDSREKQRDSVTSAEAHPVTEGPRLAMTVEDLRKRIDWMAADIKDMKALLERIDRKLNGEDE